MPAQFGNATNGAATDSSSSNHVNVSKFTASATFRASKGYSRMSGAGGPGGTRLVVYADDAANNRPGALIAASKPAQAAWAANSWVSFDFDAEVQITSGTVYWLGCVSDSGYSYWYTSSTGACRYASVSAHTTPTTFPTTSTTYNESLCVYVEEGTIAGLSRTLGAVNDYAAFYGQNANYKTAIGPITNSGAALRVSRGGFSASAAIAGGRCKVLIYADSSGVPGALVATSDESGPIVDGWNAVTFSTTYDWPAGAARWVAVISDAGCTTLYLRQCTPVSGSYVYNVDTYSDGPSSPFGSVTPVSGEMALRVQGEDAPTTSAGSHMMVVT